MAFPEVNHSGTRQEEIRKQFAELLNSAIASYTRFPGRNDEYSKAMQKINEMIVHNNHIKEVYPEITIGEMTFGLTNEELSCDFPRPVSVETIKQGIKESKSNHLTFRDPSYSMPLKITEGFWITLTDEKFNKVTRNMGERNLITDSIRQKFYQAVTLAINGVKQSAMKNLIKMCLYIYKNAKVFDPSQQYLRPYKSEENANRNIEDFKHISLTYLRKESGSQPGVLFEDINANEFQSYDEAVAAGKIIPLNLCVNFTNIKKKDEMTPVQFLQATENFIYECLNYDNFRTDSIIKGCTLNGIEANDSDQMRIYIDKTIFPAINLGVYAGAKNLQYVIPNLINPTNPQLYKVEPFFTAEEIANDSDNLGLDKVFGVIADFSMPNPIIKIDRRPEGTTDGYNDTLKTNEVKIHYDEVYNKYQIEYIPAFQFTISPNKFINILMFKDSE